MNNNENETNKKEIKRKCPECDKILHYITIGNLNWANKHNKKCKGCSFKGKVGKYKRTDEIKKEIGIGNKGKPKKWKNNELRKEKLRQPRGGRQSNEDRMKKQNEWTFKNKDKINKHNRDRYNNDESHKLRSLLSGYFRYAIKNNKKCDKTMNVLGCSLLFAKSYLEEQFFPEMTWHNHGKVWEIDHIIPCSLFNFTIEEEQRKCFHYTNLQPLFKTTKIAESLGYFNIVGNRNKGNKI